MLRLAVVGYGKMGHEVEAMALERGHEVILRIDRENAHELTPERLQFADVAIEFSSPQSAKANVEACLNAGVPVVCGTTGWVNELEELTKRLERVAELFSMPLTIAWALMLCLRLAPCWPDTSIKLAVTL